MPRSHYEDNELIDIAIAGQQQKSESDRSSDLCPESEFTSNFARQNWPSKNLMKTFHVLESWNFFMEDWRLLLKLFSPSRRPKRIALQYWIKV